MNEFYMRTSDIARAAGVSEFMVRDAVRRGIVPAKFDSQGCALMTEDAAAILRLHQATRRNSAGKRKSA